MKTKETKRRVRGVLCFALGVCWLVPAISISAAAQKAKEADSTEFGGGDRSTAAGDTAGQNGAQPPAAETQAPGEQKPQDAEKKKQDEQAKTGTSKDRMFFLMPNFLTLENSAQVPPLTTGQKFKVVARSTFDPFQLCYYVVLAGISQAQNSEAGYGQGAQGYGKRFGSFFADTTIENFMVGAVFPSLLRQDPRYYQRGKGGFARRTWYALTRIVVTRGDSGRTQFNASEVFGSAISAGISTYSYHPEGDRKLSSVAGTLGTQLGLDAFGFMMKEFWPDIRRHMHKKKADAAANSKSGGG